MPRWFPVPDAEVSLPVFPLPRSCPFHPPDLYAVKRETEPIFKVRIWNGRDAWVVTRYEDSRVLLGDKRLSADALIPDMPHQNQAIAQFRLRRNFIGMDSPEHGYYRRKIAGFFGPKHIDKLRPAIQNIVDDRLDALLNAGPPADLVSEFALPVTSLVICELLGVPYEKHEFFEEQSRIITSDRASASESAAANEKIWNFLDELLPTKQGSADADVLSRLAREVRDGLLTREEAVNTAHLLLVAGHETTAGQISVGVLTVINHPNAQAELTQDPTLADNAVEEILRYVGVSQAGRRRIALERIEYGGVVMEPGDGVIVTGSSANRDPAIFSDPDLFDIHRPNAADHLEFGSGAHICLGRPLARTELQVVFGTIFHRIPRLRSGQPVEQLDFKYDSTVYGLKSFPVAW
jgi:cytochrome P450